MALYLGGNKKLKVILDGSVYCLNSYSDPPITNGIKLLSSEEDSTYNHILKDSNGIYLTTKEGE